VAEGSLPSKLRHALLLNNVALWTCLLVCFSASDASVLVHSCAHRVSCPASTSPPDSLLPLLLLLLLLGPVTNPDMLHQSILPFHSNFSRLLAKLAYVVVDEGHAYRCGRRVALALRQTSSHLHLRAQPLERSPLLIDPGSSQAGVCV
jgi:hypothetical protein